MKRIGRSSGEEKLARGNSSVGKRAERSLPPLIRTVELEEREKAHEEPKSPYIYLDLCSILLCNHDMLRSSQARRICQAKRISQAKRITVRTKMPSQAWRPKIIGNLGDLVLRLSVI